MTYTDANGILRWEETDPITPLEATLNAGMDSVSAAITGVKNGVIHFVPDVTARAALATTFAPTATKPLYVHRQDAPAGMNLEFTLNGTTWRPVNRGQRVVTASTSDRMWGALKTATDVDMLVSAAILHDVTSAGRAVWVDPATLGLTGISSIGATPGASATGSTGLFYPAVEIFGGAIAATLVSSTNLFPGKVRIMWQISGWGPAT